MTDRCRYCRELFLSDLVALAREEFNGHSFPQQAFYQHHESIEDLEEAARKGCDLCQLILDSFKGSPSDGGWTWPTEWVGTDSEIERSMLDEAKDLIHTNVRIAINADHIYTSDSLDAVRSFDTLLVQVGPDEDLDPDPDEEYFALPMLYLRLTTPQDESISIDDYKIGRFDVDSRLDSERNFKIARSWLEQCQHSHGQCSATKETTLPSRVIDVGIRDSADLPRLLISNGMVGRYAALSHCWGGRIAPLLTKQSLPQFLDALPVSELPLNFQHAIEITRRLGVRYLWIDSLCLVQNSKKDWQAESKHMGLYYFNATITISAMVSLRSSAGIFNQTRNPSQTPKPVRLQVCPESALSVEVQKKDLEEETLRTLDRNCPLSSRGWTLQESLLSPRNLFFGSRQIYWECCEGFQAADGAPAWNPYPDRNRHLPAILLQHQSEDEVAGRLGILQKFYDWVQEFSQRKLSMGVDKLPAFSGLAQRLQPYIGGDYLAGVWRSDFRRGLLWYPEMGRCKHVDYYRAPSWSWAVTDEFVAYPFALKGLPHSKLGLDLIDTCITPQDESNPFGIIEEAMLVVEGLTVPLLRSMQTVEYYADTGIPSFGTTFWDEAHEEEENMPEVDFMGLIMEALVNGKNQLVSILTKSEGEATRFELDESQLVRDPYLVLLVNADERSEAEVSEPRSECLILEPVDEMLDTKTYRRVGYVEMIGASLEWLNTWEKQRINLV